MYSLAGPFSFHDTWKPKPFHASDWNIARAISQTLSLRSLWASFTFTVPVDLYNRAKDDGHARANSSCSSSHFPLLPQLCFTVPEKKNKKKQNLPGRPIIWNCHMSPATSTRFCHCDTIHSSVWCDTTKLNTVTFQIKINSSDKNRIEFYMKKNNPITVQIYCCFR